MKREAHGKPIRFLRRLFHVSAPGFLFGGIIFFLVFTPLAFGMTASWTVAVFRIGAALLFLVWIIHRIIAPIPAGRRADGLSLLILLLLAVYLVSSVFSVHRDNSQEEISNLLGYLVLFAVVRHVISSPQRAIRLIHIQIAIAFLLSVYALLQHYNMDFLLWDRPASELERAFATFGNANHITGYLIAVAPVCGAIAIGSRTLALRLGLIAEIVIIYIAVLFTLSRGGWIGFWIGMIGLSTGLLFTGRRRIALPWRRIVLAVVVLAVVAGLTFIARGSRILDIASYSTRDESIRQRMEMWSGAAEIIKDHPVLGSGPGTYKTAILANSSEELQKALAFRNLTPLHPHNEYLRIASETGLSALIVFLLLLGLFDKKIWKMRPPDGDDVSWYLTLGVGSGLLSMLVYGLADSVLFAIPLAILFWIDLGVATGLSDIDHGKPEATLSRMRSFTRPVRERLIPAFSSNLINYVPTRWRIAGVFLFSSALLIFQSASFAGYRLEEKGKEAGQAGRFNESNTAFSMALYFKPFSDRYPVELKKSYENLYNHSGDPGHLALALSYAERAVSNNAHFAPHYIHYAQLLIIHHKQLSFPALDRAQELLFSAVSINPFFWSVYNNLGAIAFLKNRLTEAEQHYHRALQIRPDSPEVYRNLGLLYQAMNRIEEAELAFTRVLNFQPGWVDVLIEPGRVYQTQDRLDEASRQYHLALETDRNRLDAWYNLAQTEYRRQRWQESEKAFMKSLEIDPGNINALNGLGSVYFTTKRYNQAIRCFTAILEKYPDHGAAHQNIANCYAMTGQFDVAERHFLAALQISPDNHAVMEGLRRVRAMRQK